MGLLHFYQSEWSGRQWQRTSNLSTSNVTLRGINLWYSSDTVWSFVPIARNTFLTICASMTKREISQHFFFSIDQQQQHQRISTILVCCHYLYSKNIISIDLNMRVNHFMRKEQQKLQWYRNDIQHKNMSHESVTSTYQFMRSLELRFKSI